MKFECTVEISLPVDTVVELFDNEENMMRWQPDLVSVEHISGTPGQPGAQSRMKYKKFDLIETITVNDLPREFSGEYLTEGICWNAMKNAFTPLDDGRTRYDVEIEYKFIGFMIKAMAFLMPGMFRKQVQLHIERFKQFAESEAST